MRWVCLTRGFFVVTCFESSESGFNNVLFGRFLCVEGVKFKKGVSKGFLGSCWMCLVVFSFSTFRVWNSDHFHCISH